MHHVHVHNNNIMCMYNMCMYMCMHMYNVSRDPYS